MANAMNWRYIHDEADTKEERYVVLQGERVVDKMDDLSEAQKLSDETVDGAVFDTYEKRFVY